MDTDEFLQDFVDEARGHLEKIENAFLDTQQLMSDDALLNDCFRAVHSIKGTAGFFSLKNIVALSHAMENVLGQIRSKKLLPTDEILDCLLAGNDALSQMVNNVADSDNVEVSLLISNLDAIADGRSVITVSNTKQETPTAQPKAPAPKPIPPKATLPKAITPKPKAVEKAPIVDLAQQIPERFLEPLTKQIRYGHKVYWLNIEYNYTLPLYFRNIKLLFDEIDSVGKLIDASVDIDATHTTDEIVSLMAELPESESARIEILATSVLEKPLYLNALGIAERLVSQVSSEALLKRAAADVKETSAKRDDTIRVSVELLERLLANSSEMILARNQLLNAFSTNADKSEMKKILQNIDNLTSTMQEQIMATRMQPIANVFSKFPRIIKELSRNLGKEIELVIEGKNVELDKSMVESLTDPITHLVRNACDHGLESPAEREKTGKPARGHIYLRAYHKGGMIIVQVADDGRGLNIDRIKQKALDNGLISSAEASHMRENEIQQLVFLPGFSTADSVTDLSGRGVGMDVVRSNIEKIGGSVQIQSAVGKGTTISLILPRTLAIIKTLLVRVGKQRFAIPQTNISQLVSLNAAEGITQIDKIQGNMEIRLRGKLLPVFSLASLLGLAPSYSPDKIVVLKHAQFTFGVLVDEIYDTAETLVKPLQPELKDVGVYSGLTIMGDGKINLILDVEGLIAASNAKSSFVSQEDTQQKVYSKAELEEKMLEYQNMILFACSGIESYAIDMYMVSRVETISRSQLEYVKDKVFVNLRGKLIRAIRPEDYLDVTGTDYTKDKLTLIIPNLVKHPIGILADRILDNVRSRISLDTDQLKMPGIFGTAVYKDKMYLILNLYELFEMADPINFPKMPAPVTISKRVLIVEDTPFFQRVESKYLEDAGCTVTVAQNGREALELLAKHQYDLIISDLIMPIMNGLDMIKDIRKNPHTAHVPAIAVSSMTSTYYRTEAIESGFDAYENKLNKLSLLKTIQETLIARGVASPPPTDSEVDVE